MSISPSYSPVTDNEVHQERNRIFEHHHSEDLIPNTPLYYSEPNVSTYFEDLANQQQKKNEELLNKDQAPALIKTKKRKLSSDSSSYIIRRNLSKGQYVIKLNIFDIRGKDCESGSDFINNNNNASVSVQYVVRENYDEVMDIAETLIKKISNNLNNIDMF